MFSRVTLFNGERRAFRLKYTDAPKITSLAATFLLCLSFSMQESYGQSAGLELIPMSQSRAFAQFQSRQESELSKLLYLVDRLGESNIKEVVYEGRSYNPLFISGIARMFLGTHYGKESAETWLSKWCYRTVASGQPIWVVLKNGDRLRAKDILLGELNKLDKNSNVV